MDIGTIIKELRINQSASQQEVADKMAISRSVLSQYEHNTVEPTANVIKKFAVYFDVTADYLLGLEDDFGARTAAPMSDGLTSEERELLNLFRELSPYLKGMTLNAVRSWANSDSDDARKKV